MKSVKISVIIPVFNAENHIKKCLDSVVNQTLEDIEIICIDDGSTDNSLSILREYAVKDDKIIVIANNHKGAGSARNMGLKIAKGNYISFVDSDDWIEINAYGKLYNAASFKNADMVFFKMLNYDNEDDKFYNTKDYDLTSIREFFTDLTYDYRDFKDRIFRITVSPCNKLYKRNFLEIIDAKFPEGLIYEDNPFFYNNILNAKRILLYDEHLYFRRRRKDSVMTTINEKHFDIIPITNEIINVFKKSNLFEKFKKEVLNRKIVLIKDILYNELDEKYQKQFFEEIVKDFNEISEDSNQRLDYLFNLYEKNLFFYLNIVQSKSYPEFTILNEISNLKIDYNRIKKRIDSIKERNRVIKERNRVIKERNRVIKEENVALKDKIALMESSNSWKITKPIRIITGFFRD